MLQFNKNRSSKTGYANVCRPCFKVLRAGYYKKNPGPHDRRARAYKEKCKTAVFDHYGRECACCGENLPGGLSIDHIDGNGAEHRRSIGVTGQGFYLWLVKHKFPPGYQTLCFTCNFAKGKKKVCPHQSTKGYKPNKKGTS